MERGEFLQSMVARMNRLTDEVEGLRNEIRDKDQALKAEMHGKEEALRAEMHGKDQALEALRVKIRDLRVQKRPRYSDLDW